MKRAAQNALLLLISVAAALVLGESILRLRGIAPTTQFYRPHPVLWHEPVPLSAGYRISENPMPVWYANDAQGFRQRSDGQAPSGEIILFLGDSFTEGAQVEAAQTFVELSETRLRAAGAAVSAVNAGVSGYGTAQHLLTYLAKGRALQPQLVVLAFCSGNDVSDDAAALPSGRKVFFALAEQGLSGPTAQGPQPDPIKEWLRYHTRLFPWLNDLRYRWRYRNASASEGEIFHAGHDPQWQEAWELTERLIERLHAEVRRDGAKLIIAVLPTGYQVYDDPRQRYAPREDLRVVEKRLTALGARLGIPVLTLLDDFRAAAAKTADGLFFERIGHFTPLGHEIVAQRLVLLLAEELASSPLQ